MKLLIPTLPVTALLLLAGCVSAPMGPTVNVMPGANKPYGVFQQDQGYCMSVAGNMVQGNVQQANNNQVGTAVIGTALGAGLGAIVGGGRGAAIGAGAGAVGGTLVGANNGQVSQYNIQQRYDMYYSQCMYSRGNQVPGYGGGPMSPPPGY